MGGDTQRHPPRRSVGARSVESGVGSPLTLLQQPSADVVAQIVGTCRSVTSRLFPDLPTRYQIRTGHRAI